MTSRSGFRALELANRYRSDRNDVVENFYLPVLRLATSYDRAVGYFTATSLALLARGIEQFAERGGRIRLIASPHLDVDDIHDIERGYELREVLDRATLRALDAGSEARTLDGLGAVGRLVAAGRLDIKLAFVEQAGRIGIYHEKLGVFRDAADDIVAFTGSANETMGGLLANFESIEVYTGWSAGDGARAFRLEADFEDLWLDKTPNLRIHPFPAVGRERLLELGRTRRASLPPHDDALTPQVRPDGPARLAVPTSLEIRPYQRAAIEAWLRNRGRGILKMATGTGKTKTALVAATKLGGMLARRDEPLIVVILAPFQHLVDQWTSEVAQFGIQPIPVYESSDRWLPNVEAQLAAVRLGQRPAVVMIATNASFSGDRFQSVLGRIAQPLLIIADEAHNLGSSRHRSALPDNATYRLALSATPERWHDDEGTDALVEYFGAVVYELGLQQAIEMGALCRYLYRPRLVELTAAETEIYVYLTAKIAQRFAAGDSLDSDPNSPLGMLLRQRSGVLGHAAGKIHAFKVDLAARRDQWFQLAYCAEGSRPGPPGEPDGPNQVSEALDVAGNVLELAVHSYVSDTPRDQRQVLLRRFGTGDDLRVLVAMRCLDEGVDIPDARIGYLLASSTNPRQFIQRRGRILRRAPGKDRAEIIDYIAVPPAGTPMNFDVERNLLIRELARVNEFAKIAENYEDTLEVLRPIKEEYHLLHL